MADDLLLRARALINASNAVSNVQMFPSINKNVNISSSQHNSPDRKPRRQEADVTLDANITTEFKCAAFKGSSLVTTFKDIRKFAPRGGYIFIDGHRCKISNTGEYAANRVELVEDFPGETNMEAVVQSAAMKNKGKKKEIKERNNAMPIPKEAFSGALAGLEDVNDFVNNLQNKGAKKVPMKKPLKMKKTPASMQPGYQPYRTPTMEYDISSEPPYIPPMDSPRGPRFNDAPVQAEYRGSYIGGSPSKSHMSPDRANAADLEKSPSVAQSHPLWQELQNAEMFGPEAIEKRKEEHNQRLVEKGHAMAVERVDEYYKNAVGKDKGKDMGLEGYTAYDNKPSTHEEFNNVPTYVEQQRQAAVARVKLQRQREDAEVMRKLEEELEKKKQFKIQMESRAEALRKKTEERVAEAKRLKRQKEQNERRKKEEEQRDREQRALDAANDEERLARIEQFKSDTEMRMQRREQKKEQKSRAEQDQYQWKLKQVQAKKLREVPTSEYIAQRDPKSRDPDGLGEPLDDHYMPFKPNPDTLPPINGLRSRSEQMNRTPKKALLKPKSEKKFAPAPAQQQAPVAVVQPEDRVVVETHVNSGVRLPPQKTKDQIVRQSKKDVVQQGPPELSYEEQQEMYFGRKPNVPVPPREELEGYNQNSNPKGSRGRAVYLADDDDDDDDFLDDDSLGGSPRSRKSINGGRPPAQQYRDEPIKMGYDDDDEPSTNLKSRATKKGSVASSKDARSRIPKRVVNKQELPASTEAASIALRTVVSMTKDDMDSMMDDLISDVSSQEGRHIRPPRKNHGLNPLEIPVDRPRQDPNASESIADSSPPVQEKRKKKKQVWKMAPIPIKPYIAVAGPSDKFNS